MSKTYIGSGIRFFYPDDWALSEERGDNETTISVGDLQTTQWSATVLRLRPEPRQVVREAVRAFREEYDQLDSVESSVVLAGYRAVAADLDFECLELLNCAFLRSFRTPDFTVLVMYQATERDMDALQAAFDGINASLDCWSDPTVPTSADELLSRPDRSVGRP